MPEGYPSNRVYLAQNGGLYLNGGGLYDDNDVDISATMNAFGSPAAAIADFGGSTGGTSDGDMEDTSTAVTGVDGTGNNAASKADVDSRLTSIANNFEELAEDVDLIKAALRAIGAIQT